MKLKHENETEVTPWKRGEQLHSTPERKADILCIHSIVPEQPFGDDDITSNPFKSCKGISSLEAEKDEGRIKDPISR